MCNKIKRQIKRSMPLFVIVSLVASTMAVGLVFNYDFNFGFGESNISLEKPEAMANNDTATTTVTVKNAPPTFSAAAAENPVSSSTSPVNLWGNIGFTAEANDQENNNYYLVVCDQSGVTASTTGGPPVCNNTTLCVSTSTIITEQASCTYNGVTDPGTENQDWYAYVCDAHNSEAECSDNYSQGSGDSGSPLYVNRPPQFYSVSTTDDNKDPGNNYTITATVTDGDVAGGADEIRLYICETDNWATSTGCVSQLCYDASTSPDITCVWSTSTPAVDGTYSYYAFVKDWHDLAATTSRSSTYTVNNVAPSVSSVFLQSTNDITLNYKYEDRVLASTTATISDNNGCTDIQYATGTIYWSGATGTYGCAADDDDCYPIAQADCAVVAGSCEGSYDAEAVYVCTTTLAFHALPTDDSTGNPNSGTWWLGSIMGFDEALSGIDISTADVNDIVTAAALDVNDESIVYGTIRGGQDTGTTNATTTIENWGNSPLDSGFRGTDMTRSPTGYIAATLQKYSLSSDDYSVLTWTLASTSPEIYRDIIAPRPTTAATDVNEDVYWGISIPGGTVSGLYSGINTFYSQLDNDAW